MKHSLLIALLLHISIAITSAESLWESYYGDENLGSDEESMIDYIAVDSEQQENPLLEHFYNGSYTVQDIMNELANNRSLLPQVNRY